MDCLVHHMLRTSAIRYPEKEALVHGTTRLTYREVAGRVTSLAHGLRDAGLTRGDRVGIYFDPSVPQVLSIFAVLQAGGVFVPINSLLFPQQVVHIAKNCRMRGLITTRSKLAGLSSVLADVPSLNLFVVDDDPSGGDVTVPTLGFQALCNRTPPSEWKDVGIEKDLAGLLYTSGSTGKPKGVMLSHANIMAGSTIVSTYLGITDQERILAVLPFSFDAGLNQLMTAFQQGGTLVLMTFTFARDIVQMLLQERITGLAGVPTLWTLVSQPSSALHKNKLPHLRYITNTGGAMPQTVLAVLRQALPTTKIVLMYGLTEAFRSTYLPPEELDRRPTSMGKAIPNTEILVVKETGELCRPGEPGELVHRGPTVSMGYWGEPELTAKMLRRNPVLPPEVGDTEHVVYSGDLVKMDEEGFLYFIGRRDTMIKTSGFRVSPTEVEEILFQSGMAKEAAVIGIPDESLGQAIKAFIVPKDGTVFNLDDLVAFCSKQVPRHMVPKMVETMEQLPKTPTGKVDYPGLRRREGGT
ncbi:MAG: acyl-CoA ligase (AMP-forming), exosortase A system-associated [Nitrospira sp.]|nr:MAG: acyl-CoA ligase (AMP-forming), exosortase A system-associated [Nitrospira sp.]